MLTIFGFSRQDFKIVSNTKFHGNPFSGIRADKFGPTEEPIRLFSRESESA